MKAFSGLGIGLSLVFGCLLLALAAEVCYLLRWKKKKTKKSKRIISQESEEEEEKEEENNGYAKDLIQLFCFRKPPSLQPNNGGGRDGIGGNPDGNVSETQDDLELGSNKDMVLMKPFGGDGGFEAELLKFHNQRLLFTIKEETKEDLESEDGKTIKGARSRTRSLSDLDLVINDNSTPSFLTALASPTLKSSSPLEAYPHHGLNPLFESEGELEFNKFRSSSPPPKFKFLRDAEEKLRRRLMEEAKKRGGSFPKSSNPASLSETEGSFLRFIDSAIDRGNHNLQDLPKAEAHC